MTKFLIVVIPFVLALVAAIVSNDQLSRGRDECLTEKIAKVELKQAEQYGTIQTSLVRIETRLGIK